MPAIWKQWTTSSKLYATTLCHDLRGIQSYIFFFFNKQLENIRTFLLLTTACFYSEFRTWLWNSGQGRLNLIARLMGLKTGVVKELLLLLLLYRDSTRPCLPSNMSIWPPVSLSSLIIPPFQGVQLNLVLTSGFDLKPKGQKPCQSLVSPQDSRVLL